MVSSKLKPIWDQVIGETKEYKAYGESKNVNFKKCLHKDLQIANGELRCQCGASWSGSGLKQLEDILRSR